MDENNGLPYLEPTRGRAKLSLLWSAWLTRKVSLWESLMGSSFTKNAGCRDTEIKSGKEGPPTWESVAKMKEKIETLPRGLQSQRPCKLLSRPSLVGEQKTSVSHWTPSPLSQRFASQAVNPLPLWVVHLWAWAFKQNPKMSSIEKLWDWSQEVGPTCQRCYLLEVRYRWIESLQSWNKKQVRPRGHQKYLICFEKQIHSFSLIFQYID